MAVSSLQQAINDTYRYCMLGVWLDELSQPEVNVGLMLDGGGIVHMPSHGSMRHFITAMQAVVEAPIRTAPRKFPTLGRAMPMLPPSRLWQPLAASKAALRHNHAYAAGALAGRQRSNACAYSRRAA